MNNKGFAITGILYTISILFIMILIAILTGLNAKMNLMEKSILSFETDYKADNENLSKAITSEEIADINASSEKIAPYTGKYVFEVNNNTLCTCYLKEGTNLLSNTIKFIENNPACNSNDKILINIYRFS